MSAPKSNSYLPDESRPKRFLGLDGLRGVCALTVLVYHCFGFFTKGTIIQHGSLSVDMFFILSGFVIALTYEQRLKGGQYRRDFFISRARRLFPTYWIAAYFNLTVFIALAVSGALVTGDSWWMIWLFIPFQTLTLIPDYITPDGMVYPAMDSVAWSLFAEWVAYVAYGLGAFRRSTWFFFAVAIAGWGLLAGIGIRSGLGWVGGGDRSTMLTIGILRALPAFAAGVVIYRVHRMKLFERLPVVPVWLLFALWIIAAILPRTTPTPLLDAGIVTIFSPLLVCLLIRAEHKAPAWCRRLGEISYPLYVIQPGMILIADFTPVFDLTRGAHPHPVNALCLLALAIGLAWGLAKLVAQSSNAPSTRLPRQGCASSQSQGMANVGTPSASLPFRWRFLQRAQAEETPSCSASV